MPDIILTLDAVHEQKSKEEKLKVFEEEVSRFSNWLANLSDFKAQGPLSNPERALLLTYLLQKYNGKIG